MRSTLHKQTRIHAGSPRGSIHHPSRLLPMKGLSFLRVPLEGVRRHLILARRIKSVSDTAQYTNTADSRGRSEQEKFELLKSQLLSIMSLMCYGTKKWVAMDMPHACLTKLGKILPSSFFAPGSWCKKDKWAGECNNSGVIVFQDTIVADGMERTLLDQPEETPHVCELAMFNLAFLLLGRRSFLSDAYQLVRCRSQQELLAIDVARNSIGTDSPLNYFLSIWGSQTHQPIFTRGCLHFGG